MYFLYKVIGLPKSVLSLNFSTRRAFNPKTTIQGGDDFGDYSLVPCLVPLVASWTSSFDHQLYMKTKDPLACWQNNCRTYPMLHRMALGYLSVQGLPPSKPLPIDQYSLSQLRLNVSSRRAGSLFTLLATDLHHQQFVTFSASKPGEVFWR